MYNFRIILGEPSGSTFLDTKSIYYFLNKGAIEVVEKVACAHAEQTITTVADQTNYDLNANYLGLHLRDKSGNYFIKYNDGSTDYFLNFARYPDVIAENNTDSVLIPSRFTISDRLAAFSRVTGTTTAAGVASAGESTLTDSPNATFSTSGVSPHDIVHNTTDGSDGYVISVTSETALVTALFNGTDNDWSNTDAYAIQPQGRKQLILDPPPSTAGHTITMYQIVKPSPVYADYNTWNFPEQYNMAAIYFACAMYKLRDQQINRANEFFALGDKKLREIKTASDTEFHKGRRMMVNLKKRS